MVEQTGETNAKPDLRKIFGFVAMVFGMFMAILDIQIVSSSLPQIQSGLAASADEISWIQTGYLIAEIVMIPLSGYLSRLLSTRTLYALSAISFTASSVLCAFAWDLSSMVLFRALQGFLGGAMIPTVFAAAYTMFPKRPPAVIIGLIATLAPAIGPTVGGYLTETFSWHWLFLINLIPGVVVAATVWLLIDIDKPNWSLLRTIDLPGLLAMAVFLGSLEYVIEEGPRYDWLQDETIRAFAVISAVAGVLFFWRVLRAANPIVHLSAYSDRNFTVGSLLQFVVGMGLYGGTYVMPLFLGRVRDYNALQIGETVIIYGVFMCMSAPIAGTLARKFDPRKVLALGIICFGAGFWLNSFLTADAGFWELFVPQAVRGFGAITCIIPITNMSLGTLPPSKLGNASGLFNLSRNLGGAIGLALINTQLNDRMQLHWNRLAAQINPARPQVQAFIDQMSSRLGNTIDGDPTMAAMKRLGMLVAREATVLTFNDVLLTMAWAFFLMLPLLLLVRRPQAAGAVAAH
jgi:MFS transporter, DHA2 family, multidrug resistance protein